MIRPGARDGLTFASLIQPQYDGPIFHHPNIVGRDDDNFGSARTFGHQDLSGAHILLSPTIFPFAEYRYFSSDYQWKELAVDFRDHNALGGAGRRF